MRPEKRTKVRLFKGEAFSKEYLASEGDYISFKTQYYRAIRDAYVAGYRKALETEDSSVPFWNGPKDQVDTSKVERSGPTNRLLNTKEVALKLSVSRGTIWRLTREGKFPPKCAVSGRVVRWRESEVDEWISRRMSI